MRSTAAAPPGALPRPVVSLTPPPTQTRALSAGEQSTQADVFDQVRHVVRAALSGFNGTILTYGQTGSGKSHTLIGDVDDALQRGIVPRAVDELAAGIEEELAAAAAAAAGGAAAAAAVGNVGDEDDPHQIEFSVRLSCVEIYCERIRDLLGPGGDNLQVKQDAARCELCVCVRKYRATLQ